MKVVIHGKPTFTVEMTKRLVDELMKHSSLHYDAVCRDLSNFGGLLYGTKNRFWKEVDVVDVVMSWREVDTLLKTLEMRRHLDPSEELEELNRTLSSAIRFAAKIGWRVDYVPE